MAAAAGIHPFSQSFTLLADDGTPFNVTVPDLDDFIQYNTECCITYGTQIGASIVLLMVLVLLTKPDKRGSSLFLINTLSLAFNIIRNVLQCLYFTGPFSEAYAYLSQDYSNVHTKDYAISITATIFTVLLQVCIETSLCLQTRVVCITLGRIYQSIILAVSIFVAFLAIAFRLAYMIENDKYIVNLKDESPLYWLANATNTTTTISVCWFSAVFVTKLGFALYQRRKLGLRRFGPMQIIFIMGCQTLIIPAIFSILQYTVKSAAISSNVLTAVAIFLPLSSLWASASIDSRRQSSKDQRPSQKVTMSFAGSDGPFANAKYNSGHLSPSTSGPTRTCSSSPTSVRDMRQDRISQDLEAQGLAGIKGFGGEG